MMAILIKDMEMPKTCEDCNLESLCSLWIESRRLCGFEDHKGATIRHPNCPIDEVVHCKDCKYAHMTYEGKCKYCDCWKEDGDALYLDGDFFCGFGERKVDT